MDGALGRDFALGQAAVESGRAERYRASWSIALAMSEPQRQEQIAKLRRAASPAMRSSGSVCLSGPYGPHGSGTNFRFRGNIKNQSTEVAIG